MLLLHLSIDFRTVKFYKGSMDLLINAFTLPCLQDLPRKNGWATVICGSCVGMRLSGLEKLSNNRETLGSTLALMGENAITNFDALFMLCVMSRAYTPAS